ncbi:hypothetical protein ALC56_03662, partial [Trachymyrmex septentrionalis]
ASRQEGRNELRLRAETAGLDARAATPERVAVYRGNKTINWRIERTEADRSNSNKAQTMSTLELVDATPAHPLIAIH